MGHNGLHKHLTRRMLFANLGEICAQDDEFRLWRFSRQFCSKRVFRVATPTRLSGQRGDTGKFQMPPDA